MTDAEALSLTIWGEARGEPIEGKIGVACVMRNRLNSHYRGAQTYVDVCMAHAQFSAWTDEAAQMATELERLEGSHPDPSLMLCAEVASAIMQNLIPSNVQNANHYYAISISPPAWAIDRPVLAALGRHRFFLVP